MIEAIHNLCLPAISVTEVHTVVVKSMLCKCYEHVVECGFIITTHQPPCGICLPFKPFDLMENRELDMWELPLTVMEGSLQNPDYQNLPPEAAYEEMIQLFNVVKKFKGVFVLLWHNSSFDSLGGWEGWKDVYEKFMEYISQQNAFVSTARELIDHRESLLNRRTFL